MEDSYWKRLGEKLEKMMSEFYNRQVHEELTLETLNSIPDDQIEQVIIDYIITKITDHQDRFRVISNLSPSFQMIYSTWILESEVRTGGFNQFFFNPWAEFTAMALRSFNMLGATDYAQVLENAMTIHIQETESNPLLKELYAQRTLESFFATYKLTSLSKCDDEFYSLGNRLSELRVQYIRMHTDEFVGN